MQNPNGANQYQLDPRQKACWDFYINPASETFGNAYRSALKAGYAEDTAKQITVSEWFLEKTRTLNMLSKAEKVLDKVLDMDTSIEGKEDSSLLKTQTDVAKFIASTLGKTTYSVRQEHTGADGKDLIPDPLTDQEKTKLKGLLNDTTGTG